MEEQTNNKTLQLFSNLSQLHIVRQLVLMAGLAGSIALGVAVVLWSQAPDYRVLYSGLAPEHTASITANLEQNGLDYKLDNRSGEITVPANEVHNIRLALARSGLPPKAMKGFSILDQKQSLGTSNFIERARFNRALQEELVETIEAMDGILEARVHLSIPKQTSFLRSHLRPSASVMLNLYPGTVLGEMQISGIRHLVAASTAGLNNNEVSIVDQTGNLLSSDPSSQFSVSSSHLRMRRQLEQEYADRIIQILSPLVGRNRVHAQVSADIDFTMVETTQENFDPATVVRSEQSQREESNQEFEAAGIPGVLPVQEAADTAAGAAVEPITVRSKDSSTRNYEVDRTISHIRKTPGSVNRISVAVLVDYPEAETPATAADASAEADAGAEADVVADSAAATEQTQAYLVDLVKQTIGFDEERGDTVSVVNSDFYAERVEPIATATSWLDEPLLWSALKQVGAGMVILIIIFGVLRPVLRSSVAVNNSLPDRQQGQLALAGGAGAVGGVAPGLGADDQVTLSGAGGANRLAHSATLAQYDQNLAHAKAIVESEPERAARVIQGWVADG